MVFWKGGGLVFSWVRNPAIRRSQHVIVRPFSVHVFRFKVYSTAAVSSRFRDQGQRCSWSRDKSCSDFKLTHLDRRQSCDYCSVDFIQNKRYGIRRIRIGENNWYWRVSCPTMRDSMRDYIFEKATSFPHGPLTNTTFKFSQNNKKNLDICSTNPHFFHEQFAQIDLWGLVSIIAFFSEGLCLQFIFMCTRCRGKITFNRHRHLMIPCIISSHSIFALFCRCLIHFWYLFDCMMKLTSIWNPPSVLDIWRHFSVVALFVFYHHQQSNSNLLLLLSQLALLNVFVSFQTCNHIRCGAEIVTNLCVFRFGGSSFCNGKIKLWVFDESDRRERRKKYVQ